MIYLLKIFITNLYKQFSINFNYETRNFKARKFNQR